MPTQVIARAVRFLAQRIPDTYVMVVAPDHPHLLYGPDLLIGGEGRLIAVFDAPATMRAMDALIARVIGTRLALPSYVAVILAVDTLTATGLTWLLRNFDWVIDSKRLGSELLAFATSAGTRSRDDVPGEVKAAAYARYGVLRSVAEHRRRRVVRGAPPKRIIRELRVTAEVADRLLDKSPAQAPWAHRRSVVPYSDGLVAAAEVAAPGFKRTLSSVFAIGLERAFTLDNGVPYLTDVASNILIVPTWPSTLEDPEKPIRGSAFAGWLLTPIEETGEIPRLMGRVDNIVRERLRRWPGIRSDFQR